MEHSGLIKGFRFTQGNLYFHISGDPLTFIVKGDGSGQGMLASVLIGCLTKELKIRFDSTPLGGKPEYHLVTDLYAANW
jgi:hypothetical protein